jgi:hypothetical protein
VVIKAKERPMKRKVKEIISVLFIVAFGVTFIIVAVGHA